MSISFKPKKAFDLEEIAKRKKKNTSDSLTADIIAIRLYDKAIELKGKGKWREAAETLQSCATQFDFAINSKKESSHTKFNLTSLLILAEVCETFEKIDLEESLKIRSLLSRQFCDISRYDIAGRHERILAEYHEENSHYYDAYLHYRKAANFLAGYCGGGTSNVLDYLNNYEEHNRQVSESEESSEEEDLVDDFEDDNSMLGRSKGRFKVKPILTKKKKRNKTFNNKFLKMTKENSGGILSGGMMDESDQLLEKAAECAILSGLVYPQATELYQVLAESCTHSNLLRFQSTKFLLKSLICIMGDSIKIDEENASRFFTNKKQSKVFESEHEAIIKANTKDIDGFSVLMYPMTLKNAKSMTNFCRVKYSIIEDYIKKYNEIDYLWELSKERKFIFNLVKFRRQLKIHNYIDHIYHWHSIYPLTANELQLLRQPIEEMNKEIFSIKSVDDSEEEDDDNDSTTSSITYKSTMEHQEDQLM